jgi:catechol 2,3-dioxygenase-like lactoylglutathione lyase family enzyme
MVGNVAPGVSWQSPTGGSCVAEGTDGQVTATTAHPLRARLDHVAVAVADLGSAVDYWRGVVGGGLVGWDRNDRFHSTQLRLEGGGKLELLASAPAAGADNFVRRFLERFGTAIHHVTLKVPDLRVAIAALRAQSLDVVDVADDDPFWCEGFLRPSQVGGLIVQLAWMHGDDAQWAARLAHAPERPADNAPRLLGPTLTHPDLAAAARVWRLLGATVDDGDGRLVCRWPASPLDIVVERGERAGPRALRMGDALPPTRSPAVGPIVEMV